ncbi:MAG TPA: ATP-dependent helicase HrpB [Bacteroidales bacterium]|nr:ATP-dependent helicase HrpB [Bacteroidales bacterium]
MSFNPFSIDLPITEVLKAVKDSLSKENTLIVSAPPGAGKSTLLPLALLDEPWLEGRKIIMLEPRRLAARTIAARMASLLGEEVGQTVGYRIRFDNCTSEKTRIEVITEGILSQMIISDNTLEGVGAVLFDEFHERSIFADVAMALCRETQNILRPDLRMVVMSATLDIPNFQTVLKAPVIESKGKQFPVEIVYTGTHDLMMLPELAARTVAKAVSSHPGDALVFLPGEAEIRKCEEILKGELRDFAIHPLYGQLTQSEQNSAIVPNKFGKRKIVLATSIAETSLTIQGIKIVVDSGFGRTSKFDPKTGLTRLETVAISKDSADQRAGRAGRLSAGVCYRMWSKATQENMRGHRVPEIMEADLTSLVLDMAEFGIIDIQQLTWLTPPPKSAISQATELLHELEALEHGRITEQGRKMHRLPCHPRIAHLLLKAEETHLLALATDLAAVLEERDPLSRDAGIDINVRIETLRRQRSQQRIQRNFARIEQVASTYRRLFNIEADNDSHNPYDTGFLLTFAYPERIACARPGNNAQFQLSNGAIAMAGHKDDLAHESWLAVAHLDARDGMGKIFLAAPLNPKDLAPLVKEQEVITWDTRKGGLVATKDLKIGNIVLQSKPLPEPDEEHKVLAISEAIKKEGEALLNFDDAFTNWQNRVLSLRKWRPQEAWPDVSTTTLLVTNYTWLAPHLSQVKKTEDLKKMNLVEILQAQLDWEKQAALDKLAPTRIEVPSGSKVAIQYQANGDNPILAVRLQEVFGLADTPLINEGRTPLVLHLLSPGFKPVQITSDLRSFWNNAYFEVKKDLRARYPKHSWPDDPWTAQALRGIKKK